MEVRSELCSICTRVEIELECQTVPVGSLPEGCDVSDFELDLRGGVVHECLLDVVEDGHGEDEGATHHYDCVEPGRSRLHCHFTNLLYLQADT